MDRALDFGSKGWGFDSLRARQYLKSWPATPFLLFEAIPNFVFLKPLASFSFLNFLTLPDGGQEPPNQLEP